MGNGYWCGACLRTERACEGCGRTFTSHQKMCSICRRAELPPQKRAALDRSKGNRRRARRAGAEVAGPVSAEVYAEIRESGPCVYCADEATTVDHVWPLARGGWEHKSNLVPACGRCNFGKGAKLLTEWRAERVVHGVGCSPVVAAEWARLTDQEVELADAVA